MPSAARAAGDTRLIDAVKNANGQAIRLLLRDHVDVNAAEADGTTALHWAVRADDLATVKQLLDAKADVNASKAPRCHNLKLLRHLERRRAMAARGGCKRSWFSDDHSCVGAA